MAKAQYTDKDAWFFVVTDEKTVEQLGHARWRYWEATNERAENIMAIGNEAREGSMSLSFEEKKRLIAIVEGAAATGRAQAFKTRASFNKYLFDQEQRKRTLTTAAQQTETANKTAAAAPKPQPQPKAQQATKAAAMQYSGLGASSMPSPPPASTGKAGTGSSMVKRRDAKPVKEAEIMTPDYKDISEKEFVLLFQMAYKWRGKPESSLKKDFMSMGREEKRDWIDDFVIEGLARKDGITDDLIPPMAVLKKCPIIRNDQRLLLYYERRLNKSAGAAGERTKLQKGLEFTKSVLPPGLAAMVSVGEGLFSAGKVAAKGSKGAASGLGSLIKRIADNRAQKQMENLVAKEKSEEGKVEGVTPEKEAVAPETMSPAPIEAAPSTTSTRAMEAHGESTGDKSSDLQELKKLFGDGFDKIIAKLSAIVPKKGVSEDTSVHEAEAIKPYEDDKSSEAITRTQEHRQEQPAGEGDKGEEKGKKGSGILGTILSLITSPFKMLKALLGGLKSVVEPLIRMFGSLAGKLGGLLGLKKGADIAESVAESATAKAGEKAGEKAAEKGGAKAGAKALGKSLLKKIPVLGLLAGGAFAAQRAFSGDWSGAGMELASGAASTIPGVGTAASVGIDAALAAKDAGAFESAPSSDAANVQAVNAKNNAERVVEANAQRGFAFEQKDDNKTRQMIAATRNSTIIQQNGGGNRAMPRTSDSTLQLFFQHRARFV